MSIFNRSKSLVWQNSSAHLDLLSYFVTPKQTKPINKLQKWENPLGEPVSAAIKRFLENGMLQQANPINYLIALFNSTELKQQLKNRGLSQSGTKEEMATRLLENDPKGVNKLISGTVVLICSENGKTVALEYKAREDQRKREAIALSKNELLNGNYRKASLIMAEYQSKCVFPDGMGIDWNKYDTSRDESILKYIFLKTPKLVIKRGWDKLPDARMVAGMMELWGNALNAGIICDTDTDNAARAYFSHAHFLVEINNARDIGSKFVSITNCNDFIVCQACNKVVDKKFKINGVPELPLADCENENGCRCSLYSIFR
jgi:hypothetical protein